ncbi:MAG: hypothetical protein JW797_11140 [Bradymonadales bacterium]|nr:hypothetical protein [Bradymonadales bacterium]
MGMQVTKEMLDARQQKLMDTANQILKLANTKGEHGDEIVKLANQAQKEAQELEAMAKVYEAQSLEGRKPAKAVPTTIYVELTDEQRKRILDETGVRMERVEIPDDTGIMERTMPVNQPPDIYPLALQQARSRKALEEAEQAAMADAAKGLAALKAQRNPDMDKLVEKAKADPNFLCGLLQKQKK